ncbi:MAG: hypothetical protein JWN40_5041 [Phycisphaerales bacterium]|nr:hypothetical protein [Phycisphaerales bacterium]
MAIGPFSIIRYHAADAATFIEFWNNQYDYDQEHLYDTHIGAPITPDSLAALFEWKNGSALSAKKQKSIQQYLFPSERIAADADLDTLKEFLCRPGGAIWRIYWLHIQHPQRFPIYDQHVHRAMASLSGSPNFEIPKAKHQKVSTYLNQYLPFMSFFQLFPIRKVDRALWAYGRFLSFKYRSLVAPDPA